MEIMTVAENSRMTVYREVMKNIEKQSDRDFQGALSMIDNCEKFGFINSKEAEMLRYNMEHC